jgi:hypothetical protein
VVRDRRIGVPPYLSFSLVCGVPIIWLCAGMLTRGSGRVCRAC